MTRRHRRRSARLRAPCRAARISISSRTAATRASSTRSVLVMTKMPRATPRRWRMSRCSSVCGITPSSAATMKSTRSMPCAPASMLRMKRSWPGTSTTPTRSPPGRVELGEAQVDRDAARLLLLAAVRVLAGEGPDERRLAVVDVAGRADDARGMPQSRRARRSERPRASNDAAQVEQEAPVVRCGRRPAGARRGSARAICSAERVGVARRRARGWAARTAGSAPLPDLARPTRRRVDRVARRPSALGAAPARPRGRRAPARRAGA